ncbi:uncharacterized protein [Cherax quadricarinatus]|uniref:uncharacterized protein isoform X4 n=1 Tax=Cherax quadricarinatus TaxID=27406 RepID=UPI00387E4F17
MWRCSSWRCRQRWAGPTCKIAMASLFDDTVNNLNAIVRSAPERPNSVKSQVFAKLIDGIRTDFCIIVYRCILGAECEVVTQAVRLLAEKLDISRPLLLSLTVPALNHSTVIHIAEILLEHKCW